MTDNLEERQYTQSELSLLLRRAAELQGHGTEVSDHRVSQTEAELIAAEAGIDPKYVRAAAEQLSVAQQIGSRWFGPGTRFQREKRMAGEATDETGDLMLAQIKIALESDALIEHTPQSPVWRWNDTSGTEITITRRAGVTELLIASNRSEAKFLTYAGIGLVSNFATVCTAMGLAAAFGPADAGLVLGGGLLAGTSIATVWARRVWTRMALQWHQRLDRAVELVAGVLEERR